eukprot:g1491.t1
MSSVNSHHYLAENLLPLRVEDEPRFAWRGLLVDTARHFFSVDTLKRVLDGMAAMKLNTFHWHITDSQSYPIQLDSLPKLAEFSVFDSDAIYTKKDITDIVSYANDRGIRVVPEIDMPSHSASFGLAYPELTIKCEDFLRSSSAADSIEKLADKIALHPLKNETYDAVQNMMRELLPLFQDRYMHIGGDEMSKECLEEDPDVRVWRSNRESSDENWNVELQRMFTRRVVNMFENLENSNVKNLVFWDEITSFIDDLDVDMSSFESITSKPVVQYWRFWRSESLTKAIQTEHSVVVSSNLYLDYLDHTWETYYENQMSDFSSSLVLGGEACSWSESVDESNLDTRIFQRLPAIAERLWSSESVTDKAQARQRLSPFLCRLHRTLGIRVSPVESNFCMFSNDNGSVLSSFDFAEDTTWFRLFLVVVGAVVTVVLMRMFRALSRKRNNHAYQRVSRNSSSSSRSNGRRLDNDEDDDYDELELEMREI